MAWKNALYAALSVPLGIGVVPHRRVGEERRQHRAHPLDRHRHAGRRGGRRDGGGRARRPSLGSLPGARDAPGHRAWPARPPSRAGCRRACPPGRPGPAGAICSISERAPTVGGGREAAADHLAENGESGCTPYSTCAPTGCTRQPVITSSKTSSAPARRVTARSPSRNPCDRRDHPHVARHRLDQHRGDLRPPRREQRLDRGEIVERRDQRVGDGGRP